MLLSGLTSQHPLQDLYQILKNYKRYQKCVEGWFPEIALCLMSVSTMP